MRKTREILKQPKLDVFVVGEGITEQYYFTHLRDLLKLKCKIQPRFFGKTSIKDIDDVVRQLISADMFVICVFDLDTSERDKTEKEKLDKFISCYKDCENVIICTSLPSIEYWFLIHYKDTNKYFNTSKEVTDELKKYIKDYKKKGEYLKKTKWVEELLKENKLQTAIERAKRNKTKNGSFTNIYEAIERVYTSS